MAALRSMVRPMVPARWYQYLADMRQLWLVRHEFRARGPAYCTEVVRSLNGRFPRECPLCGYTGLFLGKGMPPRLDCWCPQCRSVEKHRLLWLTILEDEPIGSDARILHFAPEACLQAKLRSMGASYLTADLFRIDVDRQLNIEALDLEDESVDVVICNHVLEHVSHRAALAELYRVLAANGRLFATIPIIEGWPQTYENSRVQTETERDLHFGQCDHVRYFGSDFRNYVREAGFELREYTADGQRAARYGLMRGEKVFVGHKRGANPHHA